MDEMRTMLAERACEKLQIAYALTADQGDADGFTALFAEDASIHIPEYPPFAGHAAIHASLVALATSGVTMRHVVTNQHVTATGPRSAEGSCYLIVFDNPGQADANGLRGVRPPSTIGEYHDRFLLTPAGWRFGERRLTRVFKPIPETTG
jgi:hypothetical protein